MAIERCGGASPITSPHASNRGPSPSTLRPPAMPQPIPVLLFACCARRQRIPPLCWPIFFNAPLAVQRPACRLC